MCLPPTSLSCPSCLERKPAPIWLRSPGGSFRAAGAWELGRGCRLCPGRGTPAGPGVMASDQVGTGRARPAPARAGGHAERPYRRTATSPSLFFPWKCPQVLRQTPATLGSLHRRTERLRGQGQAGWALCQGQVSKLASPTFWSLLSLRVKLGCQGERQARRPPQGRGTLCGWGDASKSQTASLS